MKKIKNLFAVIFALALAIPAQALVLSTNISGAGGTNSIFSGPLRLYQVTMANTAGAAGTITFFDAPGTSVRWTNASYTLISRSLYPSNTVTTYTNFFGVTENWTNATIVAITNTVAGTTNSWPMTTFVIPANTTYTFNPESAWVFTRGLLVTNSTNSTITFDYLQP